MEINNKIESNNIQINKKMKKNIIFILVFLNLILSSCSYQENLIKKEIEKANYCETDQDCILLKSKCPFGCYITINKKETQKISEMIDSYESKCVYGCIQCNDVECKDNICKPIC